MRAREGKVSNPQSNHQLRSISVWILSTSFNFLKPRDNETLTSTLQSKAFHTVNGLNQG